MEIVHALRGLSINNSSSSGSSTTNGQRLTMSNKADHNECSVVEQNKDDDDNVADRKRNKLKCLPPKSPKKSAFSKSTQNNKKEKGSNFNNEDDDGGGLKKKSHSLAGYYDRNDKKSVDNFPISRKSSLSSLTSLIQMSPRLFPRFGSKSGNPGSGRKRSNPLSPHRENACTNDFKPVNGSSRSSSRCPSPAPSDCHSLPSAVSIRDRSQSPDLMSVYCRINPIGNGYRPDLYLDPNQGKTDLNIPIGLFRRAGQNAVGLANLTHT